MIKPSRKPYGYRELLAYRKSEELQDACSILTHEFPKMKTLVALADQMDRSARSVKQNIVEGWKRNSTREYYEFLGFSIGANTELEEDCNDIWKERYPELLKKREIMGERGVKGEREREELDIESLRFYPVDPSLPPVVRLKLRCKELNFLLEKLQKSLLSKMKEEETLPSKDKRYLSINERKVEENFDEQLLREYGMKRLENGQVVKDE
jgi:four helix bundle protein